MNASLGLDTFRLGFEVLLELAHEGLLFGMGLEATVAPLGARVDPLEVDVLESDALGVHQQRLKQN